MSLHVYEFQREFAKRYAGEGLRQGLLLAINGLTQVLGISLSAEQRETLEKADAERLAAIYEVVLSSKRWPAVELEQGLEEFMPLHGHAFLSEFAKKYAEQGYKQCYEEGYREGYKEGLKEGLVRAIEGITEVLGISLSAEQRATLAKADVERLEAIYEALLSSKQWPDSGWS
jgi:flagellar biosynthesis/type III secretory pathway protein FliH